MSSCSVVLAALIALVLQVTPARDAGTAAQGGASIKGRVVDAATKAPLSGARVRLTGSLQRGPVLTDDAGAFAFAELPAGTYSFVVERNGYLPRSWPNSQWIRRREGPIELAAAGNLENVTLPIERGGVVAGKVMTAKGEPVTGAQVLVAGSAPPAFNRFATTNDLGEFRVADLAPGRYILRAQLRVRTSHPPETPLSGPLPTYYPGTLQRSEAQELVVGRGGDVTEANLRLVEGMFSLLDVTATLSDGRPVDTAMLTISSMAEQSFPGFGDVIRKGVGRLELPPGEYALEARAPSGLQNTKDSVTFDLIGNARVRLSAGAREAVTMVIGTHATASGRIVFEGVSPTPAPMVRGRIPMVAVQGQNCHFGSPTLALDWTFKIDGLAGTCRSTSSAPLSARWTVKSVILDDREALDENVWFQPGRHYENVRIVMTDLRSQVRVRASEMDGTPTGEYVAVAFPVQRERWRHPDRYIKAAPPLPPNFVGKPDPSGTGGEPGRSVRLIGLPPGDYHLIAVDDIEYNATHDPAILEKLAQKATRVTIQESGLTEVPLQRYLLSDVIK